MNCSTDTALNLSKYVFDWFHDLWTTEERLAHRAIQAELKAQNVEGTKIAEMLRKHWGSNDPAVLALVKLGPEKFQQFVIDRLLRECADQIVFNRCPKCQSLARTPRAKQCPKCFHSWHNT